MQKIQNIIRFKIADLLSSTVKAISFLRAQNFYKGLKFAYKSLNQIEELINNYQAQYFKYLELDINHLNEMLMELLQAQINKDYILLADLYELKLNPYLLELQQNLMSHSDLTYDSETYSSIVKQVNNTVCQYDIGKEIDINNVIEGNYSVEYTAGGLATLAILENRSKYYIHSNNIITKEAWDIAKEWYSQNLSEYVVYGLGLGYHIQELLELDETLKVKVYESDLNIIHLACAYGCMKILLKYSDRFTLIYDPNLTLFKTAFQKLEVETGCYIYYPSLKNINNTSIREEMEDYFIAYSSILNQRTQLYSNFKKNILMYDYYVDTLRDKFMNKDLYIIAAGPSLDINFHLLKKIKIGSIILATGTVLKKLVSAGIEPDFVIITDATEGAFKQIENIETSIPLLCLSTVNNKVTKYYKGKKYLICQKGFELSQDYALKKGYSLFNTGGSVSTTALDIGIQFGCRRIIFLGLDLAYTKDLNHASDTRAYGKVDMNDCRTVIDINGKLIKTGKNLDIYRKWIEKRISSVKDIEFIDATEGGALIKGMKLCSLLDLL